MKHNDNLFSVLCPPKCRLLGKLAPQRYGKMYCVLEGRRGVGRHGEEMLGCGDCKEMHTED